MSQLLKRQKTVRSSLDWRLHFERNATIEPPIPWDSEDRLIADSRQIQKLLKPKS